MFNLFKKKKETEAAVECNCEDTRTKAYAAYHALTEVMATKKATKADLVAAIEEAVGHLGEILAD